MARRARVALLVVAGCGAAALLDRAAAAAVLPVITVCPAAATYAKCDYTSLNKAAREAPAGSTVLVGPGIYREGIIVRADRVTIRGVRGAHIKGAAASGKAAIVVKGDDVTIEAIECSRITVPNGNGACIRAEGMNLTVRGVYFHDSQSGILGGRGRLVVEDSRLKRLGGDIATDIGHAHAIYAGKRVDELIVRRSRILSSKEEGHEIKSRARRTVIEGNVIASLDGRDSRLIDVPNGGVVVIRGNVLEKGPNSSNPDVVGIGLERTGNPKRDHAINSTVIADNTIIFDRVQNIRLFRVRGVPPPKLVGNTIVGGEEFRDLASRWFPDRAAAGLPAYPRLPDPPKP